MLREKVKKIVESSTSNKSELIFELLKSTVPDGVTDIEAISDYFLTLQISEKIEDQKINSQVNHLIVEYIEKFEKEILEKQSLHRSLSFHVYLQSRIKEIKQLWQIKRAFNVSSSYQKLVFTLCTELDTRKNHTKSIIKTISNLSLDIDFNELSDHLLNLENHHWMSEYAADINLPNFYKEIQHEIITTFNYQLHELDKKFNKSLLLNRNDFEARVQSIENIWIRVTDILDMKIKNETRVNEIFQTMKSRMNEFLTQLYSDITDNYLTYELSELNLSRESHDTITRFLIDENFGLCEFYLEKCENHLSNLSPEFENIIKNAQSHMHNYKKIFLEKLQRDIPNCFYQLDRFILDIQPEKIQKLSKTLYLCIRQINELNEKTSFLKKDVNTSLQKCYLQIQRNLRNASSENLSLQLEILQTILIPWLNEFFETHSNFSSLFDEYEKISKQKLPEHKPQQNQIEPIKNKARQNQASFYHCHQQ